MMFNYKYQKPMSRKERLLVVIEHKKEMIKSDAMGLCAYGDSYFDDLKKSVEEYEKYRKELKNILNNE